MSRRKALTITKVGLLVCLAMNFRKTQTSARFVAMAIPKIRLSFNTKQSFDKTQGSHYSKSRTFGLPCYEFSQNAIQRAFCRLWRYRKFGRAMAVKCLRAGRRSGASRRYICFVNKANSICASHSICTPCGVSICLASKA